MPTATCCSWRRRRLCAAAVITARSCISCCRRCATLDCDLGDRVTLIQTDTYTDALEALRRPVLVHEPTSHAAEQFVHRLKDQGLVADILPTPTFALPRADFAEWAGDRTRFRMEDFYREQRRRFDVLMDGDEPVGGRWNYDTITANPRRKSKRRLDVPKPYQPREDDIDEQGPARPRPHGHRHRRQRRPATVRRHSRRGAAGADPFRRAPAAGFRPLRGRHDGPGLGDVALAAVRAAEPRRAAPARCRPTPPSRPTAGRRPHWPPSRVSSVRSWAGANTCGICTGTSARATSATTPCARTHPSRTGGATSTPMRSPPRACATR